MNEIHFKINRVVNSDSPNNSSTLLNLIKEDTPHQIAVRMDRESDSHGDRIYRKTGGSIAKSMKHFIKEDMKHDKAQLERLERNHKSGGKIDINIKRPGALHKEMGIPEDKKIPIDKLKKVKKSAEKEGDTRLVKQAVFAENAKKWNKK